MDSSGKSPKNEPMDVSKERIRTNVTDELTGIEARANCRQEELKKKINDIVDFVDNIIQKIENKQYGIKWIGKFFAFPTN